MHHANLSYLWLSEYGSIKRSTVLYHISPTKDLIVNVVEPTFWVIPHLRCSLFSMFCECQAEAKSFHHQTWCQPGMFIHPYCLITNMFGYHSSMANDRLISGFTVLSLLTWTILTSRLATLSSRPAFCCYYLGCAEISDTPMTLGDTSSKLRVWVSSATWPFYAMFSPCSACSDGTCSSKAPTVHRTGSFPPDLRSLLAVPSSALLPSGPREGPLGVVQNHHHHHHHHHHGLSPFLTWATKSICMGLCHELQGNPFFWGQNIWGWLRPENPHGLWAFWPDDPADWSFLGGHFEGASRFFFGVGGEAGVSSSGTI